MSRQRRSFSSGVSAPNSFRTSTAESLERRTLFAGGIPAASVSSPKIEEPATGQSFVAFEVTLDEPAPDFVRFSYATRDGTATAGTDHPRVGRRITFSSITGSDFQRTAGRITFAPGQTTQVVNVPVLPDNIAEGAETFSLHLRLFNGTATLADPNGTATIHANAGAASSAPSGTTVPFSQGNSAVYTGTTGKRVRVSMRGAGSGLITLGDGGLASVTVNGSTADTAISIAGRAGLTTLDINGPVGSFNGPGTDFFGDISINGPLGTFAGRNAVGEGRLLVNGGGSSSITFADVRDYAIVGGNGIGSIHVREWADTDDRRDEITASGTIGSIQVARHFRADVFCDNLESMSVGGAMSHSAVYASTTIGSVRTGALLDSRILAGTVSGADPSTFPAPDALADLGAGQASIGSVTVFGAEPGVFRNSIIAARDVGDVITGRVGATNGTTPFGVYADRIASVRGGSEETGGYTYRNLDAPGMHRAEIDFRIRTF